MKKYYYIVLLFLLIVLLELMHRPVYASDENVAQLSSNEEYLYDPETKEYLPVRHLETEISVISEENGHDYEFERLFEEKRANDKERAEKANQTKSLRDMPIPGGVGYGVFYTSSFQSDFTTGTSIFHNIVCPSVAGGDVDNYLYLTSTNRAAKGVEALISYYDQNYLCFKVYDWAQPESNRWQVNMTYANLSDYFTSRTVGGVLRQCITLTSTEHICKSYETKAQREWTE